MSGFEGIYLKFSDSPSIEVGPFEFLSLDGGALSVNHGGTAVQFDTGDGLWHVTDHEALGNPALEGQSYSIILGQAK